MSAPLDRDTFDRLVLEHLPAAQRFAIRLTGTAADGEELVQDALLKVHRGWQSFRVQSQFRTWLFQVIVNCFRDRCRRRGGGGDEMLPDAVADARAVDPAAAAQERELGERVAAEVSRLPPRQREVLVLIAYEQLSTPEVAAMLQLSEQNVRTTLHLARQKLRQRLERYLDPSRNST
jgi:RNA polymerase sigma-70 factor (ECF subfamily)